jgi:hypothetical protein
MKTFHHSTLESPRLAKLLAFLRQRGQHGATTFEITAECLTTRASSDISELRANGIQVDCSCEGMTETGRKINRYKLA